MGSYQRNVGDTLRTLRQQRDLTLREVAQLIGISIATLSRIERGEKEIKRSALERIIQAYQLHSWDTYQLMAAAGFIPEPSTPKPSLPRMGTLYTLHDLVEQMLLPMPSPGCILDRYWYVKAWNHDFEAIRPLSRLPVRPVHVVDSLFMNEVQERLGDVWESYMLRVIHFFSCRICTIADEQQVQQVIDILSRRYGTTFTNAWHQVQHMPHASDTLLSQTEDQAILCGTPYGIIKFLLMRNVFSLDHEYELITLVPFGVESEMCYQQFKAAIQESGVHFS